MHRRDLESVLGRGWQDGAASELDHWRSCNPEEALRISDELRRSVRELRPDWPTAQDRDADLASHIRVVELLRRVEANRKH